MVAFCGTHCRKSSKRLNWNVLCDTIRRLVIVCARTPAGFWQEVGQWTDPV